MNTKSDKLGSLKETLESQHTLSQDLADQIAVSEQVANGIQSLLDWCRAGGKASDFIDMLD